MQKTQGRSLTVTFFKNTKSVMKRLNVINARTNFTAKRNFRRHLKEVHKDKEVDTDDNLEERNVTVSANIAHLDPDNVIGDLLVVPLDPLTNDRLPLGPLPASSLAKY